MGISGSDHAISPARSGILRSGAGRSGWPILAGKKVPLYALSGVARSGATRSNYHSSQVFVKVDGVHRVYGTDPAFEIEDLRIRDVVGHEANRATFTARGFLVRTGMDVIITLGSKNNLQRLFAGQVLPLTQRYVGMPENREFDVNVLDYTFGMDTRKVTTQYTGATVATIAAGLITACQGYAVSVHSDIASLVIDEISFTNQDPTDCFTHLMKRVSDLLGGGGDWKCGYDMVVRCFVNDTSRSAPQTLNAVHTSLELRAIVRDPTSWITRVLGEGGGSVSLMDLLPGDTEIPVLDPAWYRDSGGEVYVASRQRLSYNGRLVGGGGSLVGPGAAPSAAPSAAPASGAGVTDGDHDIAVTFVTGVGQESIPGPRIRVTAGVVAAPVSAPTAGAPTIGSGPDPGTHDYAVGYKTSSGDTTPGPRVTVATTTTAEPVTAPTHGAPTAGGSIDPGLHDYALSYVTPGGETTPGPISGSIAVPDYRAPTSAPTFAEGATWPSGSHGQFNGLIKISYIYPDGTESLPSPPSTMVTIHATKGWDATVPAPPASVAAMKIYMSFDSGVTYPTYANLALTDPLSFSNTSQSDTGFRAIGLAATGSPVTIDPTRSTVPLSALAVPTDPDVTSKRLWRRSGGAGLKLVTSLAVATTTYSDTTANASLGAAAPTTNTATRQRIPLTLPTPPSPLVTHVNIYGTAAGGAQLKVIASVAVGTGTYLVTTTDAGLGANAPTSNTATANQFAVANLPIGAAAVTGRNVYMSPAGSAQLKLAIVIANNTATDDTITTADGSLGANAPTSDTSGLAQPSGQVLAGSTTLLVAGTAFATASGGWALLGSGMVVRYTGITGSSLTGIPATGRGSITATVGYNTTVMAAPVLIGIPASGAGSIQVPILKGDDVNVFVQEDDLAGQIALAAKMTTAEKTHDGIVEDVLQDRRLSETELRARARAWLARRSREQLGLRFLVRDQNAAAGVKVPVNLGPPTDVIDELMIQEVEISNFTPGVHPDYEVTASSEWFSFDEYLRLTRQRA